MYACQVVQQPLSRSLSGLVFSIQHLVGIYLVGSVETLIVPLSAALVALLTSGCRDACITYGGYFTLQVIGRRPNCWCAPYPDARPSSISSDVDVVVGVTRRLESSKDGNCFPPISLATFRRPGLVASLCCVAFQFLPRSLPCSITQWGPQSRWIRALHGSGLMCVRDGDGTEMRVESSLSYIGRRWGMQPQTQTRGHDQGEEDGYRCNLTSSHGWFFSPPQTSLLTAIPKRYSKNGNPQRHTPQLPRHSRR